MAKRYLILACVMVVVSGSMASAAEWVAWAKGTNRSGTGAMANAMFGEWGWNVRDGHSPTVSTTAQVSVLDPNFPGELMHRDQRITPPTTWTLLVHAGWEFNGDKIWFKMWNGAFCEEGGQYVWQPGSDVQLRVEHDPMGRHQDGEVLWTGAFDYCSTELDPIIDIEIWANKSRDPYQGLVLGFGSIPTPSAPEPATFLVLLCGVCGLMWRRRRA